jgi:hypothetical protein
MPRAANGIADDEAGGQRGAVMCTHCAYSETGAAASSHENRLSPGVALQHATVDELGERNSARKVGASQFLFLCHCQILIAVASAKVHDLAIVRVPHAG